MGDDMNGSSHADDTAAAVGPDGSGGGDCETSDVGARVSFRDLKKVAL